MEITVISDAPSIVSGDGSNSITTTNNSISISASPSAEVLVVGGMQGLQGPVGPAGGSTISFTAPVDLGGNRVVTSSILYADSSDLGTVGKVIGLTTAAATSGSAVNIQTLGELNGFFGLVPNEIVYLSSLGTLSQTPPLSGYLQKIGIAVDSTTLLINISEPIVL